MKRTTLADSLADCLDLLGVSDLKGLADVLGIPRQPQRRAELLDRVCAAFTDGALRGLWERLPAVERAAVSEVVHSGEGTLSALLDCARGRGLVWHFVTRAIRVGGDPRLLFRFARALGGI